MTPTPETLREWFEKYACTCEFHGITNRRMDTNTCPVHDMPEAFAHADAWEADIEDAKAYERMANRNADVIDSLRKRLEAAATRIHNLLTCKGNATDNGPCGQCRHDAEEWLAALAGEEKP